jgi:hypothetical protein
MANVMTALRATAAVSGAAAGAMVLLFWGIGFTVWTLAGLVVALMAFSAAAMAARRYYIQAATPSGVAAVVAIFLWMPPKPAIIVVDAMLLLTCALAFYLYEVD